MAAGLEAGGRLKLKSMFRLVMILLWVCLSAGAQPLVDYHSELNRFMRVRGGGPMASSPEAQQAYWRALLEASDEWVRRWPEREFAWRDRLTALVELADVVPGVLEATADGALRAMAESDGVGFSGEDTRLRIARAYVRHGVRLERVRELVEAAESSSSFEALDVLALLAERNGDAQALRAVLAGLERAVGERPAGAERRELIAWASRRRDFHLHRARLARIEGDRARVWAEYGLALEARPVHSGRRANPQNRETVEEVRLLWLRQGRSESEWSEWLAERRGVLIPPARRSAAGVTP